MEKINNTKKDKGTDSCADDFKIFNVVSNHKEYSIEELADATQMKENKIKDFVRRYKNKIKVCDNNKIKLNNNITSIKLLKVEEKSGQGL